MIEIINRYTKAILYSSASTDVIARAVSKAIESGANLSEADLSGAKQRVLQIQGSQHQIVAIEHEVRIGCHVKPLAEWLAEYKTIGEVENYASAEIEEYGLHLKHIKAILGLKKRELYTSLPKVNEMIAYASNTGTKRNLAALRKSGWRILVTPAKPVRPEGFPAFAIDNGAWSAHINGTSFNEKPFLGLIERYGSYADWIVIPDIVGGGCKSLEFSVSWIPRLQGFRRLLLAVQDGMTRNDIEPILRGNPRMGIFLGGSTEWKLKTMYDWGLLACAARRWYHVGRVNSARRIRLVAESGADSFDGTSASMYSITLPLLEAARQQPNLLIPSCTPWP